MSDLSLTVNSLLVSFALLFLLCGLYLTASIKVLRSHERAVIVRMGRRLGGIRGPGILLVLPALDRVKRIDLDNLERATGILAGAGFTPVEAEEIMNELRRAKAHSATPGR